MSNDAHILEMRPVAMSLLVVATGDTRTIPQTLNIVHNAAFRLSLELVGSFPELARRSKRGDLSLGGWLADYDGPRDFFIFCGRLLDAVDRLVRGRHSVLQHVSGDEPSAYDHAAYLALGQTICRAGGVRGAKFPPIEECFSKIAEAQPRTLQKAFLTNYIGNVLQDYFDASRIRSEFSSLSPETEGKLRSEDAAALSDAVFARLDKDDGPIAPLALQQELQDLIGRVWLAEKALDD